jgi:cytochrome c-type biogenesis protein CcmF
LVALKALGLDIWASGLCFGLCAFVTGTITQEYVRGANVRRRNSGTDFFTALVGLVGRNKRRYGGYIVHLGIVLMFLGFAGTGYKLDEQVALKKGAEVTVGKYTIRNDGIKVYDDGQKQMTTAYISVFQKGKQVGMLYPAKWAFRRHEQEPTTEVGIRRTFAEDLYIVMPSNDPATLASQVAPLEIVINPLVNWIWLGFGVLAFGTGIAMLPERTYSFALAKMPAEAASAASTAGAVLLLIMFAGTTLSAQQGMPAPPSGVDTQTSYYARTDFEKQLQHEIVCTCGCGHTNLAECRKDPCGTSHQMRGELAALIDQGKSHDEIIQSFVTKYGNEEMLGIPMDRGFRRLSWLLPLSVGVVAAAAVGVVARRWSRQDGDSPSDAAGSAETELDSRLDDELRNLD